MNQAEHAQELRNLKAQNDKSREEQQAALKKVQDALDAAGGTTPEVDAAMAELRGSIQTDDDLNPDAVPPTEPTEPTPTGPTDPAKPDEGTPVAPI